MNKSKTLNLIHFQSMDKDYVLEVHFVKEIIRMAALTRVDELPPFVRGIINLRGESLPIIDFLGRAGGGETRITLRSRVMVMKVADVTLGLLVDDVLETLSVLTTEISANVQPDVVINPKYIAGTFYRSDRLLIWVDVMKLFSAKEFEAMEKI